MRRDLRILLATVALGLVARYGPNARASLSEMKTFEIRDVQVVGTRYLTPDDVIERLALLPGTSVWTDKAVLEDRLLSHPMIRAVEIDRRVPKGLRVTVTERQPIALAPTPTLEPVDAEGRRLPLDPSAYRLDLPIIASSRTPPAGSTLFTEDVRQLAAEVHHLMSADTAFLQMVSSVRRGERGTLIARWTEPSVEFLLPPMTPPSRLREGLGALSTAMSREPGRVPAQIDLRFADQVVVRRTKD